MKWNKFKLPEIKFEKKWVPKVICVILAIICWLYIMDANNPTVTRVIPNVPVNLVGIDQLQNYGLIVGDIQNDKINVKVTGPWKSVIRLSDKDIALTARVSGATKGKLSFPIEQSILAAGATITSLSESSVTLNLDAIVKQQKPIKVEMVGKLPEGVELGELNLESEKVEVEGASEILKHVAYVEATLDVSDKKESFTGYLSLVAKNEKNEKVEDVKVLLPFIEVKVPFLIEKSVPIDLKYKENFSSRFRLAAANVTPNVVKLKGDKKTLEALEKVPTEELTLSEGSPTNSEIQLNLPEGISFTGNQKFNLQIDVRRTEVKTFQLPTQSVQFVGEDENYTYTIQTELKNITVKVTDTLDVLNKINPADLSLTLDVNDRQAGYWDIEVSLKGIQKTSSYHIEPSQLPIQINRKK
ncbi:CdaR family protein [Guggenheimella bovis]